MNILKHKRIEVFLEACILILFFNTLIVIKFTLFCESAMSSYSREHPQFIEIDNEFSTINFKAGEDYVEYINDSLWNSCVNDNTKLLNEGKITDFNYLKLIKVYIENDSVTITFFSNVDVLDTCLTAGIGNELLDVFFKQVISKCKESNMGTVNIMFMVSNDTKFENVIFILDKFLHSFRSMKAKKCAPLSEMMLPKWQMPFLET